MVTVRALKLEGGRDDGMVRGNSHGDRDWREILGRVINGGLPPSHWKDSEVAAFQVRVREVAGEFCRVRLKEVSYGAAKAAQANYTMSAALELARYGITANMWAVVLRCRGDGGR